MNYPVWELLTCQHSDIYIYIHIYIYIPKKNGKPKNKSFKQAQNTLTIMKKSNERK